MSSSRSVKLSLTLVLLGGLIQASPALARGGGAGTFQAAKRVLGAAYDRSLNPKTYFDRAERRMVRGQRCRAHAANTLGLLAAAAHTCAVTVPVGLVEAQMSGRPEVMLGAVAAPLLVGAGVAALQGVGTAIARVRLGALRRRAGRLLDRIEAGQHDSPRLRVDASRAFSRAAAIVLGDRAYFRMDSSLRSLQSYLQIKQLFDRGDRLGTWTQSDRRQMTRLRSIFETGQDR